MLMRFVGPTGPQRPSGAASRSMPLQPNNGGRCRPVGLAFFGLMGGGTAIWAGVCVNWNLTLNV